jgi:hypothetical protein
VEFLPDGGHAVARVGCSAKYQSHQLNMGGQKKLSTVLDPKFANAASGQLQCSSRYGVWGSFTITLVQKRRMLYKRSGLAQKMAITSGLHCWNGGNGDSHHQACHHISL